ncbi:MAG: flagellar basal body-associated FliL family protein [Syntrophobacteraceae bacterium]
MPPEAEEKQEDKKPAKSSKKIILIAIIALVLLGGGGAGAYFKFFAKGAKQAKADESPKEDAVLIISELDTFIVNLSDPGGKRFLKTTLKARLDSKQASEEFGTRGFELRETILMILSAKESEEIMSTSDKQNLKQEIVTALNRVLRKGKVKDVYFTEFLVQ